MDKKLLLETFLEKVFKSFSAIAGSFESRNDYCDNEIPPEVCSFNTFKCIWKENKISEIVHNNDYSPTYTIHFNSVTETWRVEYKKSIKEIFEWLILKLFQLPKTRVLNGQPNSSKSDHFSSDNNNNNDTTGNGKSSQPIYCSVCSPSSSKHFNCNCTDLDKEFSHTRKALTDAFIWNTGVLFILYCIHQTQLFRAHHKPGEDVFIRISLESFQLLCMSVEGYTNTFYYSPYMRENNTAKKVFDTLLSVSAFQLVHLPIHLSPGDIKAAKEFRSQVERAQHLKSHQKRLAVRIRGVCEALRSLHEHKLQFLNILCLVPSIVASYSELAIGETDNPAAPIEDSKELEIDTTGISYSSAAEENGPPENSSQPLENKFLYSEKRSDSGVINMLESLPEEISNFDEYFFGTAEVEVQDSNKSSSMPSQSRRESTSLTALAAAGKIPVAHAVEMDANAEMERILADLEEQSREVLSVDVKSPSRSGNSAHYISKNRHSNAISDTGGGSDDEVEEEEDADDDAWMNDIDEIEPDLNDKEGTIELTNVSMSEESVDQSAQEDLARLLQAIEEQSNSIIHCNSATTTTATTTTTTATTSSYSIVVARKRKVDDPIGTTPVRTESYISEPEQLRAPNQANDFHSEQVAHSTMDDSIRIISEESLPSKEEDMENLLGLLEEQSAAVLVAAGNQQPDSLPVHEGDDDSGSHDSPTMKKRKYVATAITRSTISANPSKTERATPRRKKTSTEGVTPFSGMSLHVDSLDTNTSTTLLSSEFDIAALLSSLEQQTATVLVSTSSPPSAFPSHNRSGEVEGVDMAPPASGGSDEATMLELLQQLEQLSEDTLRQEVK